MFIHVSALPGAGLGETANGGWASGHAGVYRDPDLFEPSLVGSIGIGRE